MSHEQSQPHVLKNNNVPQVPEPLQTWYNGFPESFDFNKKASKFLGIAHITIGLACIICHGLLIGRTGYVGVNVIGHGIWGGALFIAVGIFQLLLTKSNTSRSLILTTMVLSIVAASVIPFIIIFAMREIFSMWSFKAFLYFQETSSDPETWYNCQTRDEVTNSPEERLLCLAEEIKETDIQLLLGTVMTILAFIEVVLCIATSAICCNAVCCRKNFIVTCKDGDQVIYYPNKSDFQAVVLQRDQESVERKVPQNVGNNQ